VNNEGLSATEKAAEALARSERRFRALTEKASELLVIVDATGTVTEESPNQAAILGFAGGELLGRCVFELLHPEDGFRALAAFQEVASLPGATRRLELRVQTKDGLWRWLDIVGTNLLGDSAVAGIVLNCRDVTERKQAEEALHASEEQYRLLAENTEDFVTLNDIESHRLYISPSYSRRTGWTLEELRTTDWRTRVHPDDLPRVEQARDANLRGEPTTIEHRTRCKDGSWIWVETHCKPLPGPDGKVQHLLVCSHDITGRKQAEESLRQLTAELEARVERRTAQLRDEITQRQRLEQQILEVIEREQRRISHDIHDSLGQRLTGARFLISALSGRLALAQSTEATTAAQISGELDKALAEVRSVCHGLDPIRPDPESLMAALHDLSLAITEFSKIPCQFECPDPVLVHDQAAATHLYRIAQEAANNAVRHAHATHIRISLRQTGDGLRLNIHDDGCGLPPPAARHAGMGLDSMKHRARLIGATCDIRRARTGGTTVGCLWPPPPKGASHAG
jgi:PAS domain S-box-containing protein